MTRRTVDHSPLIRVLASPWDGCIEVGADADEARHGPVGFGADARLGGLDRAPSRFFGSGSWSRAPQAPRVTPQAQNHADFLPYPPRTDPPDRRSWWGAAIARRVGEKTGWVP